MNKFYKKLLYKYCTYGVVFLYIASSCNHSIFYFTHFIAHQELSINFEIGNGHHHHHHGHTADNDTVINDHSHSHDHSFTFFLIDSENEEEKGAVDNTRKLDQHKKGEGLEIEFNDITLLTKVVYITKFTDFVLNAPPTPPPQNTLF